MSINFDDPMNDEAREFMHKLMGNPVAEDDRTALFDKLGQLEQAEMKRLANAAKQPVQVELNSIGDIKEVGGVKYRCDKDGWKKLPIGE